MAALVFAGIVTAGSAAAQPPPAPTLPTPPLVYPYAIAPLDIHSATLRDQPNMHGIAVVMGPDGAPHMFCVDGSEANPGARLRRDMQTGVDSLRYK